MKPNHDPTDSADALTLGEQTFASRLILGTGKFASTAAMVQAVKASGAELVTVALRRVNRERPDDDLFTPLAQLEGVTLMPNTSGARNAREAITAARLARQLCDSRFIKVEIHPNPHHLMPDALETYEACRVLAAEGFWVMPYMPPHPVLAKRREEVGCVSVMALGSAIGSGHGLAAADLLRLILRDSRIPVIVDAGLRAPSEAAAAMEMGCGAVLVNSAIAVAGDAPAMATAFAGAVRAGRAAYRAGLMPRGTAAVASSPLTAFLSTPRADA